MITYKAEIHRSFNEEFIDLVHKFEIYDLTFGQARSATEPFVSRPGVYVFFQPATGAHWVAALEDFFEQRLAPTIPSLRRC